MVKRMELLIGQLITGSARPDWTLLALSFLLSATLFLAVRSVSS
jgi:hypothetical protein